jgi:hypothetical protein
MSSSIPQTRSVPESGVEGPAFKKQRLEANDDSDTRPSLETAVRIEVDEEISQLDAPVRVDSSTVGGANSISKPKKSKKKRKDPPLPEPCSAADVLYQEIRTLLGEAVVDRITEDGGAFKSPYSYGEEIVVTAGSVRVWWCALLFPEITRLIQKLALIRFWHCRGRRRQRSLGDCRSFRAHGRNRAGQNR